MSDGLLIKARLGSPLAGDPPQLDGLLIDQLCLFQGYRRFGRNDPLPADSDSIRIPIAHSMFGGANVPLASSPIFAAVAGTDRHEHVVKKLAVEYADMLAPERRLKIAVGGGDFKSYRLPLRVRLVPVVAWFAIGDRRTVLKVVRRVRAIGHKRSIGYGRVAEWTVDRIDADYSWFAPSERGPVLMRPLPEAGRFPAGLIGARPDFVAVKSPYWHPDRYMEAMVPC